MLSNSGFVKTHIPVWHNSIKSLIFRVAELLLVFAFWKMFSLLAAARNCFSSFLVFSETPIQKAYFVWSRGLSKDALLVASFTAVYAVAQFYGTLLWALDAPGHVIQRQLIPASPTLAPLLDSPEYIVSYTVTPSSLNSTDAELAEALSVNLFQPGANVTLTGSFEQGVPETVPTPSRPGVGPRIWLDNEGWSVTTDTYFHVVVNLGAPDSETKQLSCGYADISSQSRYYNCTFHNEWVPDLLSEAIGTPLVHYNEGADSTSKFGTIGPKRDDPWQYLGTGSGAAVRFHMFTATKGYRRHTFVSTIVKTSIVATEGELPEGEIRELMARTAKAGSAAEQDLVDQGLTLVMKTLMAAQKDGQSAAVGLVSADAHHVLEAFWELLLLADFPGRISTRVFRLTTVNITLLRSETISTPPVPFETCENAFQNEAVGGKVIDTDCIGGADFPRNGSAFYFGQVDTSAVLHLDGLDHAPFASSAAALDPLRFAWVEQNVERLTSLLLSRGYILGLDPNLVTVQLTGAIPGISYLQLFLVLLAASLAVISWASLWLFASSHWSSSFLVNILCTTRAVDSPDNGDPGVVCRIPDIRLEERHGMLEITTDTGVFVHLHEGADMPSAHVWAQPGTEAGQEEMVPSAKRA